MSRIKDYVGVMPKYLAKVSKFGGQYRITLPRLLVEQVAWESVEYVVLRGLSDGTVVIKEFIDGESLGIECKKNRSGSDW
jgi:hypothetical protein